MPILDVDKAHTVMVIKRSMSPGFAGIDNELYYMDKTLMLFGDAKAFVTEILKELPAAVRRVEADELNAETQNAGNAEKTKHILIVFSAPFSAFFAPLR